MATRRSNAKPKHRWIDLPAAIGSGLIAGTLFCVLEVLLTPLLQGESFWTPLRMIGGIAMGRDVAVGTGAPGLWPVAITLGLHLGLSVLYACIGCLAFHRLACGPPGRAAAGG